MEYQSWTYTYLKTVRNVLLILVFLSHSLIAMGANSHPLFFLSGEGAFVE